MDFDAQLVNRPSLFWLVSEPGRALTELGMGYSISNILKNGPKGDGHPVMILPGFMSTKNSTALLRKFVDDLGYHAYDWGLGRNMGKLEYMDILSTRLQEIYKKTGEPISLIGWSLGGVFAREIAKANPDITRQVITLGSPFGGITQPNNVTWIYNMISGGKKVRDLDNQLLANLPLPAPVPTTAIYSKQDGIVPWQMCMEAQETPIHQNIEVRSSHIGLAVNPSVLTVISDRLKYDKENWEPFKPKGYVRKRLFFPSS